LHSPTLEGVGPTVGAAVVGFLVTLVGDWLGDAVVGATEGLELGASEDGTVEGAPVGAWLGTLEGAPVGSLVGGTVGEGAAVEFVELLQMQPVASLPSSVTAPVWAKTAPDTLAPVLTEMLDAAMIVPARDDVVPSVAEDPTTQNTLHG
jgi:hypothetical protein